MKWIVTVRPLRFGWITLCAIAACWFGGWPAFCCVIASSLDLEPR